MEEYEQRITTNMVRSSEVRVTLAQFKIRTLYFFCMQQSLC